MKPPVVTTTIDFDTPGKRLGYLNVPRSTNASGWSTLQIGIGCIVNGDGPTALVLGGNHGDEYEGQITALNALHNAGVDDVHGRLIIVPCLSPDASRAGTRLWPSGANFNRSFPGSPDGPPNEQLADYLTRVLFPMADVVIDMHAGGRGMSWMPVSHMHLVDNGEQRSAMLEGMLAWNTNFHVLYIDIAGSGLLPGEAERQGKVTITTELGGGHPSAETLRTGRDGLFNVLRSVGVLAGTPVTRADLGLADAVLLDATAPENYLRSPESGLYEVLVTPGDAVQADQPVGKIHFLERLDRPPQVLTTPAPGHIVCVQAAPNVTQGDCVTVIGQPTTRAALS